MTFEEAERLKSEFTDKYVVVEEGIPELKRFESRTGQVKTVNMSGRALVEFDSSEDISWYDIDPSYLKVVDKPEPKSKAAPAKAKEAPAAKEKPAKPAAKKGMSPLEMARAQGAAGKAKTAEKPAATGDKPLSPLERARLEGAAGSAKKPAAEKPAPKKPAAGDKPLSPLERARMEGAVGSGGGTAAPEKPAAAEADDDGDTAAVEEAPAAKTEVPTTGPDGKPLSKIELARLQGPFKG